MLSFASTIVPIWEKATILSDIMQTSVVLFVLWKCISCGLLATAIAGLKLKERTRKRRTSVSTLTSFYAALLSTKILKQNIAKYLLSSRTITPRAGSFLRLCWQLITWSKTTGSIMIPYSSVQMLHLLLFLLHNCLPCMEVCSRFTRWKVRSMICYRNPGCC